MVIGIVALAAFGLVGIYMSYDMYKNPFPLMKRKEERKYVIAFALTGTAQLICAAVLAILALI